MKCEDTCLHKLDWVEERVIKANEDLEKAITDTKSKAADFMEVAKKSHREAIVLMDEYLKYAYLIIENEKLESPIYEELWCKIYKIAMKRCEKVKEALENRQITGELLCRLKEVVAKGKNCKYTCHNPYLRGVDECIKCAEDELTKLMAEMDNVHSEHRLVAELKPAIEKFREGLKGEVHSKICKIDRKCLIRYQEQERALMIDTAYTRAIRIQKKLAKDFVFGKVIVAVKVIPGPPSPSVPEATPEKATGAKLPEPKAEPEDDDEECECDCDDEDE